MKTIVYTVPKHRDDESHVRVETGKAGDTTIDLVVANDDDQEAAGLTLTVAQARAVRNAIDKAIAEVDRAEPTDEQAEALGHELCGDSRYCDNAGHGWLEIGRAAWLRGARPTGYIGG